MIAWSLNLLYATLLVVAAPWLIASAIRKGKYRAGFAEKFLGRVPHRTGDRTCVWLHAVSVGEVNLLGTLISEMQQRRGDLQFFISTTTATGHAIAGSLYAEHTVFYCPLDFSWAVNAALRRVRPDLLVLAELELWPNLIGAAKRGGAKVAVINGRMSERSFRGYNRLRWLVGGLLRQLDVVATQTDTYAERFRQLGALPQSVVVTGSLKFDGAETNRQNADTLRLKQVARLEDDDVVFLAGSTQEPEEAYAIRAFCQLRDSHPRLKLVLVPRHPDRFEAVAKLLDESGVAWQRRSNLECGSAKPQAAITLVDKMGELRAWWGTTTIAFVGGSFGEREGQNMIEPAAYGAAVSFGPRTRNFRDVVTMLLDTDAARVVSSAEELAAFVEQCLKDPRFAAQLGEHARQLVLSQRGATVKTVDLLERLLPPSKAGYPSQNAA